MRRHNSRFLVSTLGMVLLLSLVMALVGCGSGNGGGSAVDMMKKLPEDANNFGFTSVAGLRTDKDLDGIYEDSKDGLESDIEDLGISAADVDSMTESSGVTILEGSFDLDDVGDELEDNGYEKGEYKDIETWEGDLSVGLVSTSSIVIGDDIDSLEDCLDVIKGDADSLYDDADLRDLMGRLPAGLGISVSSSEGYLEGLKAVGSSVDKKDADTLRMTMMYLFEDGDAAGTAISSIEDHPA